MNDNQQTKEFLASQQFMVLAVTLDDDTPWAVPVRIQAWNGRDFEWDSKLETIHSKAIEARPEMAITVFQKFENSQIGFYARGRGERIEIRDNGFGRYKFTAEKMWLNDETFVKREVTLDA